MFISFIYRIWSKKQDWVSVLACSIFFMNSPVEEISSIRTFDCIGKELLYITIPSSAYRSSYNNYKTITKNNLTKQ